MTTLTPSEIPSINEQLNNDLNREGRPPLCIDCHHIATNRDSDPLRYKCLAGQNYLGASLVSGEAILRADFCYQHRVGNAKQDLCGMLGTWFKKKEPSPILSVEIGSNVTPAARFNMLRKTKISEKDLDNL